MVTISNAFYENEIHMVDSPQRGLQKYNFLAREVLISGEGRPKKLGEMAKNRETFCYAN